MNVRTHPRGEVDDSGPEGPQSGFDDPPACEHCGAMAGTCAAYPNCPNGPAHRATANAPISVESQIECVQREIRMREHVYPRRVADGKMTQRLADRELATMRAVLATLEALPKTQPGLFE